MNIGQRIHVWHTRTDRALGAENVTIWTKYYADMESAALLQSQYTGPGGGFGDAFLKTANRMNDVNYEIAYSAQLNGYVVTIAREKEVSLSDYPCVHLSQWTGYNLDTMNEPIISENLSKDRVQNCKLDLAESSAHNSGFVRDEYGSLASIAGHSGGKLNYWVYYGNNDTDIVHNSDLKRIPFNFSAR